MKPRASFASVSVFLCKAATLVVFASFPLVRSASANLDDGLIAYYPFNDNALDYSGNGNHGTPIGVGWEPGVIGQSASFDGETSTKLCIPDSNDSFDVTGEYTLALWVYALTFPNQGMLLTRYNSPSTFSYEVGLYEYYGRSFISSFSRTGTDTSTQPGWGGFVGGATEVLADDWYHVAVVHEGTSLDLYIDGQLNATSSPVSDLVYAGNSHLCIGSFYDAAGRDERHVFHGLIDEVRIYNRALLPEEVAELASVCGNGNLESGEDCDDGNTADGDCCSSTCQFEPVETSCADGDVCNGVETCDGLGTCNSATPLVCNDDNLCTQDSCDSADGCLHTGTPTAGCLTGGKVSFKIEIDPRIARSVDDDDDSDSDNELSWKWRRGEAVTSEDLGDPLTTTTYALCVYDSTAGVSSLAGTLQVDPNGAWRDHGEKGWSYKDKTAVFGGVSKLKLRAGKAGKSKAELKAGGSNFVPPVPFGADEYFDQDPDVTVQLVNSEGVCWTSVFTTAKKNTAREFKTKTRGD